MVTEGFLPEELTTLNRAEIQELLYQSLFGQEDSILTVYNPSTTQNVTINDSMEQYSLQPGLSSTLPIIEWKVPVKEKQALYFDCFDSLSTNLVEPINKSFDIAINHVEQETEYPSKFENGLLYLGTYENEIVAITATLHKKVDAKSFGIYGMDLKKLQRAISNVKTPQLSVQGGTIKGVCEAKNGQQLFLPISYDNGFEAKVNGRPVSVQKAFDCFMAIPLEEGTNTIEINYHLPGLKIGLLMAVFGLVGVLWIGFRKQKEKQYVRLEQCSWVLLKVLMILVLLLIYIAPVGLWLYSHYVL